MCKKAERLLAEKSLIHRILEGDQKAFNKIYERYHAQILATMLRRTQNRQDAEDLVQITFLNAFRDLPKFRGEATLSTWLMQIAINACNTHLRAKHARRSWHKTIADPQQGFRDIWEPARVTSPDDALNHQEHRQILEKSISKLPQQYRTAVQMRYLQEQSYTEITYKLNVPMGTLKTWLHRARVQLQKILENTQIE